MNTLLELSFSQKHTSVPHLGWVCRTLPLGSGEKKGNRKNTQGVNGTMRHVLWSREVRFKYHSQQRTQNFIPEVAFKNLWISGMSRAGYCLAFLALKDFISGQQCCQRRSEMRFPHTRSPPPSPLFIPNHPHLRNQKKNEGVCHPSVAMPTTFS